MRSERFTLSQLPGMLRDNIRAEQRGGQHEGPISEAMPPHHEPGRVVGFAQNYGQLLLDVLMARDLLLDAHRGFLGAHRLNGDPENDQPIERLYGWRFAVHERFRQPFERVLQHAVNALLRPSFAVIPQGQPQEFLPEDSELIAPLTLAHERLPREKLDTSDNWLRGYVELVGSPVGLAKQPKLRDLADALRVIEELPRLVGDLIADQGDRGRVARRHYQGFDLLIDALLAEFEPGVPAFVGFARISNMNDGERELGQQILALLAALEPKFAGRIAQASR